MLWFAQGSASLFLMVAELRAQERQAAEELGQWKTRAEERKVIDASQAAITLAMLMAAELEEVEKRAGVGEIAGRRRQVDQMSQALNRLRAMVSLPKHSPPMPR